MNNFFGLNIMNSLLALFLTNPFNYNLGITIIPCNKPSREITLCCHGYGDSSKFIHTINSYDAFSGHIIGFNFPDYNISQRDDHRESSFGTLQEILPLLYILKQLICGLKITPVNLYGFSAGGGAIINLLSILLNSTYDDHLKKYDIEKIDKERMLVALKQGYILLDCPLKSIEEIIAFRGHSDDLAIIAEQYSKNNMIPINVLNSLQGLDVNILLHFQNPDEILSNRDDNLFIEQLSNINRGTTSVSIGLTGTHSSYHEKLWANYKEKIATK